MKIEELLKAAAELREQTKQAIAETKEAAPHLVNAAGALHTAALNLEGHIAAAKAKAEAPKK
jgi:hypothetical protein